MKNLTRCLLVSLVSAGTVASCRGAIVTATYSIGAENFQDSNGDPPNSPSTTTVRGQFSFTFDTINDLTGIAPDSVQGIQIRDNNGLLHVYDPTNSGVNADVNQFLDTARITFGGNVSGPGGMVGLTDDFGVTFDIDTTNGAVTDIHSKFAYLSTVDPLYSAQDTLVLLTSYNVQDADLDDDGDVDGIDFLIAQRDDPSLIPLWESQYGSGAPLAAAGMVPEPSAITLLVAVAVPFACLRKSARA